MGGGGWFVRFCPETEFAGSAARRRQDVLPDGCGSGGAQTMIDTFELDAPSHLTMLTVNAVGVNEKRVEFIGILERRESKKSMRITAPNYLGVIGLAALIVTEVSGFCSAVHE